MNPPIPSAIVFDLGKVLIDFDYGLSAKNLAESATSSAATIKDFIDHSPLLFNYEKGHISSLQFYHSIQAETGYPGSFEEFAKVFADIFSPIDEMIDLHQSLRTRGFATYIFSNTNELAVNHIKLHFPFFSRFDGYVYSYEHGSMKPDAALYKVVESITGRREQDILYLDDRLENVEAGRQRNWQVIHHQDVRSTFEILKNANLFTTG